MAQVVLRHVSGGRRVQLCEPLHVIRSTAGLNAEQHSSTASACRQGGRSGRWRGLIAPACPQQPTHPITTSDYQRYKRHPSFPLPPVPSRPVLSRPPSPSAYFNLCLWHALSTRRTSPMPATSAWETL